MYIYNIKSVNGNCVYTTLATDTSHALREFSRQLGKCLALNTTEDTRPAYIMGQRVIQAGDDAAALNFGIRVYDVTGLY